MEEKMMRKKEIGFTILELVITLAIMLIIIFIGIPSMKKLYLTQHMASHVNAFVSMQRYARQSAIFNQSLVTMCASDDGTQCLAKKYWHEGMIIFIDKDGDKSLDDEDRLLKFYKTQANDIQVTWRAFQNKSHLQFRSNGWTNHQNGTFRFCFDDEAPTFNRALIVNRAGRARLSTDSKGDGVHDDANGDNVKC